MASSGADDLPDQISDALFVDLYQLTMAQAYLRSGQEGEATFSLYFRTFPENRAYYVFAGLESALDYLRELSFSDADIAALERLGLFDDATLDYLRSFRFGGSARAMREGEVFFASEPVMEVSGSIIECQIVETFLLNRVNLESMLATKAARVVDAARGRQVFDFAARRTHGLDASMKFARASHIAGFDGTSNVRAASELGIPAVGTMAHSFITSFHSEVEAFRSYARAFPQSSVFLVDTYDTLDGVRNAITVAREMAERGDALRAARLDSGDMDALSRAARQLLDDADLCGVRILASGGLDEYSIDDLVSSGAPIDGFGVGTRVGTSADAPYTDFVYKIVEYDGKPVMKLSEGKANLPGAKQVYRRYGADGDSGVLGDDVVCLSDEPSAPDDGNIGEALLAPVMRDGELTAPLPSLSEAREYHRARVATLPDELRGTRPGGRFEARLSEALRGLVERASSVSSS